MNFIMNRRRLPLNSTIGTLCSHRSIRKYTEQPIEEDTMKNILLAGQAAASSNFFQAVTIIRVKDSKKREALGVLANNQSYVASAAEFLVFCADLDRAIQCCDHHKTEAKTGFVEQFIIATVDVALVAQNVSVAAESIGLGICYIGALRNEPEKVSDLLELPKNTFPVFGLCIGWPAEDPHVKPRMPLELFVHENKHPGKIDKKALTRYDWTMSLYYSKRTTNKKVSSWSEQMSNLLSKEARPHMRAFLQKKGFIKK